MNDAKSRLAFFRQSGWMMFTAVAAGAFNYAVHGVARHMPKAEYGVFTTLLAAATLMGALVGGIAIVFTQKAAEALHEDHERELAGMLRGVLRATFVVWLVAAAFIFLFRQQILADFKITNPAALWLTVAMGLAAMWLPLMLGLLQGRQDFLWLGGANILNGVGRFAAIAVAVLGLGWYAAGGVGAVLCGFLGALLLGAWHNRRYLRLRPAPVDWSAWWRQAVPLTFGFAAATFMLTADMPFVQRFFPEDQTGYYAAAGLIGRALVYFTQALTTVLLPKIVRSLARAQKTDVLAQALGATALVGGVAAIGCTLFPTLPLRLMYGESFLAVAGPLVPWFAWSMLPLTLSNVLVTSLLARRRFAAVPWMVAVAVGYGLFLYFRHDTFLTVIRALGAFNLLLLLVCGWFSWRPATPEPTNRLRPAGKPDGLSVLVVFVHGLGDNVMLTGPLREYHRRHPSHRISLLILDNGSPAVWSRNPHVEQLFTSRTGRNPHYWDPLRYWWKDYWELRREIRHVCRQKRFDRVIHVSIGCMPELYYRLTGTYGAHKTVRIAQDLGIPAENLTPELHLQLDTAGAEEFLRQHQLQRFAVLHPFSRYVRRGLEASSIQQVVETLRAEGLQVVVAGRSREVAGSALNSVVPAVDLPLSRLLAIISRAEVFLGTESGIAHLAGIVAHKMVLLSTRSKRLQLTNCGPLSWGIPYCKAPVEVLEMTLPEAQRQSALSEKLRRLIKA